MSRSDLKLKICGLRDNVVEVLALQPDFTGFIFYPGSRRFVGDDFVMPHGFDSVKKVGVFVNAQLDEIVNLMNKHRLDYVQLHGEESAACCRELYNLGVRVIKVFSGNQLPSLAEMKAYEDYCAYFLLDNRSTHRGGTGEKFDWSVLDQLRLSTPIMLSGGIGLSDLPAIEKNRHLIVGIDVNSHFEERPGYKKIELLKMLKEQL